MRKPRDFDSELKALDDKARVLRERKLRQLGELVIATGADGLPVELLAGVLLAAVETRDTAAKEACRVRGAAFFRRSPRGTAVGSARQNDGAAAGDGKPQPSAAEPRA